MDYSNNFITLEQLKSAIELPLSDVWEFLNQYVYFKGLVYSSEKDVTYVDGYFIVGDTEVCGPQFTMEEIENDYHLTDPDIDVAEIVINLKADKYSNNDELVDTVIKPKSSLELNSTLYSYEQLCELMEKFGCPKPRKLAELPTKNYSYDINLVNQKSNFTLNDAAKIAANIYTTGFTIQQPQLFVGLHQHYLELLSDCIKGTNQHNFKLHTVELWCSYHDEFGDRYSKQYDNGTYLKQKAILDHELTIISKQEFVRWCEYERVDTGLTFEFKEISDSIEALKQENEKLKAEISQSKIKELNKELAPNEADEQIYPPELQLAIDAYKQLCRDKEEKPTNEIIKKWLKEESEKRGITHQDGSKSFKGLSDIKLKTIPSIIKSQ